MIVSIGDSSGKIERATRIVGVGEHDGIVAATEPSELCLELEDGRIVMGTAEAKQIEENGKIIRRAWLQPTPIMTREAAEAIEKADTILFGPGLLYHDIASLLTIEGMHKGALRKSTATFVFVGPTSDISALETFLPRSIDKQFDTIDQLNLWLNKRKTS